MGETIKEYTNGEITVVWKPETCIHSARCFKGLPSVFDPNQRPWITMSGADTRAIREQVAKCPSGALSIKGEPVKAAPEKDAVAQAEVVVFKNGPVMVKGALQIKHKDGREERQEEIYLCRCGQSANKPFCDGAHRKCGFKDE
jgi:uncharacterized Fe-S cluster protein YjdI